MSARKRILITGATGMLGGTLVSQWENEFEIYTTSTSEGLSGFINHKIFDLKTGNYEELITWAKPDVILHAAAITNGNTCHEQPEFAFEVNGFTLFKLAKATGPACRIIYISTDAVFANDKHLTKESDLTAPESTYGKSKELGEFLLQQYSENYTIVRTTVVGINQQEGKKGFAEWIVDSAKNKDSIKLFNDVIFNPISCTHLGNCIADIIHQQLFKNEIVHISGGEVISKYTFGMSLLNQLGIDANAVEQGSIMAFEKRAKRSTDQSLDCSYFVEQTKQSLPDLDACTAKLAKEYKARYGT